MPRPGEFGRWLSSTMGSRGLTQADVARAVGVADAQVSRWRRGHVVPTVHYLQRIAEALDVPRVELDRLAGYPVVDGEAESVPDADAERLAELRAAQARLGVVMQGQVPRELWRAYLEACEALARSLTASYQGALKDAVSGDESAPPPRRRGPVGFQP